MVEVSHRSINVQEFRGKAGIKDSAMMFIFMCLEERVFHVFILVY